MPIPVPISSHNEPLPPDALTDIRFNFEWRRLVVELLWPMTDDSFWSGAQPDIEDAANKATVMLEDIYTVETVGGDVDYLGAHVLLVNDWTITTTETAINFGLVPSPPAHNVGAVWSAGSPSRLTVPVDGAGFYKAFAAVQLVSGTSPTFLRIRKNSTLVSVIHVETQVAQRILLGAVGTIFLADGDFLETFVKTTTGTRLVQSSLGGFDGQFGMYRVGLAS